MWPSPDWCHSAFDFNPILLWLLYSTSNFVCPETLSPWPRKGKLFPMGHQLAWERCKCLQNPCLSPGLSHRIRDAPFYNIFSGRAVGINFPSERLAFLTSCSNFSRTSLRKRIAGRTADRPFGLSSCFRANGIRDIENTSVSLNVPIVLTG